jgi:Domain of Unknown Function (DUF928)
MAAPRFSHTRNNSWRLAHGILLPLTIVSLLGSNLLPASAAPSRPRKPRYVPAQPGQPPVRTEAGGTRGCARNAQSANIQLLIPTESPIPTISDRPELFWYLSNPNNAEIPIEFSLIKPGVLKPLYHTTLTARQSGVMSVRLPNNIPALGTGETYRWMVSLNCDTQRSSDRLERRAWIKRIATPDPLKSLTPQTSPIDQLNAYGESGLWYDALAVAAPNRNQPEIKTAWQELLEDNQLPPME